MKKWTLAISLMLCLVLLCSAAFAQTEAKQLPETGSMYANLDLTDPYKTTISGLYEQPVTVGEATRLAYVYIGAENRQSEPFVMLMPDSGVDNVNAWLAETGWQAIADAEGLILCIAQPSEGAAWDVEADVAYLDALYKVTHARGHYNAQKGNNYMAAYGNAATLAQRWAMKTPQNFASFASFGDIEAIPAEYMEACAAQGTKLADVSIGEIPMPVWFFVSEMDAAAEAVLAYWNGCNDVDPEKFSTELATGVYIANNNGIESLIDEQEFLAQTRYTVKADPAAVTPEITEQVWAFLSDVVRPVGFANNSLRAARSVEEWGAVRREIEIDGVTRYWVEFVPEKLSPTTEDGKVPMVVYSHGNNNTAESMLARSEFIKVANDRGFIAILMTGCLYKTETMFPNPRWNLEQDPELFDDYAYIRGAVADACSRLPVDTTRIYAMGQSYGGAASLHWALRMNDIFAAAAGTGAWANLPTAPANCYEETEKNLEGNLMPICVLKGVAEGGTWDAADFRSEMPYWLNRNGMVADVEEALTGFYKSGRFNVYEFANEDGVPLCQYLTVDERIHTVVASDMYFQYDNFVSKWSREADGTLYYMGKPVSK